MKRIWWDWYGQWQPPWWQYIIPWFGGGDEYGRDVMVIHIPIVGFIFIPYRTCYCEVCDLVRSETAEWEKEEREST